MQPNTITLDSDGASILIHALLTKKALLTLRALNHPLRQQLLQLIDETKHITVTELFIKLKLEQSVVSQHLAILRKAGFVITRRKGKYIYYEVNYERVKKITEIVEKINS